MHPIMYSTHNTLRFLSVSFLIPFMISCIRHQTHIISIGEIKSSLQYPSYKCHMLSLLKLRALRHSIRVYHTALLRFIHSVLVCFPTDNRLSVYRPTAPCYLLTCQLVPLRHCVFAIPTECCSSTAFYSLYLIFEYFADRVLIVDYSRAKSLSHTIFTQPIFSVLPATVVR